MTSSPNHPALQLFHQERQELMEQVGQALTALVESPSLPEFQRLRRSVRLIHQGAVQMQLGEIEKRTSQFLQILHPDTTLPEDGLSFSQIETLTQLFRELQQLETTSATPLEEESVELNSVESDGFLEDQKESSGADLMESGSALGLSQDIRQILLQNDIAEVITQLDRSLSHLSGETLLADVMIKLDALLGWGEVLDWSELVIFAGTMMQGLKAHPEAVSSISALGVLGLQSLHREAIRQLQASSEKAIASKSSSLLLQSIEAENTQTPDILEADEPKPYAFETAKKFIWQSQRMIFVVDSEAIAETLIPKPAQIISRDHQRFMQWQGQVLPMISLRQLLAQGGASGKLLDRLSGNEKSHAENAQSPVLVINTEQGSLALEIDIEQFVRAPSLSLTPVASAPDYCLGTALWDGQNNVPLIDVSALLARESQLAPPVFDAEPLPEKLIATASVSSPSHIPGSSRNGVHILVVDDSRTIRYLLQKMFEQSGYRVTLATDGLDAIQQLEANPDIALMVSDVEMPNLNGFELVSRCRRQPQWQNLPIIILSQCPTDQHQQLSQQFGADAYLPKPFDHATFITTVASLLRA